MADKIQHCGRSAGGDRSEHVAAEWAHGSTTVGFPGGSFTMDFDTVYLLLSQKRGTSRYTARVERFSTRNHLKRPNDQSREHGNAVTVAWLRDNSDHLRSGLEFVRVKGDRPAAPDPRTGGSTITLELRYRY